MSEVTREWTICLIENQASHTTVAPTAPNSTYLNSKACGELAWCWENTCNIWNSMWYRSRICAISQAMTSGRCHINAIMIWGEYLSFVFPAQISTCALVVSRYPDSKYFFQVFDLATYLTCLHPNWAVQLPCLTTLSKLLGSCYRFFVTTFYNDGLGELASQRIADYTPCLTSDPAIGSKRLKRRVCSWCSTITKNPFGVIRWWWGIEAGPKFVEIVSHICDDKILHTASKDIFNIQRLRCSGAIAYGNGQRLIRI